MRRSFTPVLGIACLGLVSTLVPAAGAAPSGDQTSAGAATTTRYVVLAEEGASLAEAKAAAVDAGGTVVGENAAIGTVSVESADAGFAEEVADSTAVSGAARNGVIGNVPADDREHDDVERLSGAERSSAKQAPAGPAAELGTEPLEHLQWNLEMIDARAAHQTQDGDDRVLVGIIDTGIDGSHPDIAPNFNAALSRNFTIDIPAVDGPCQDEADGRCTDPADVDENGHGTHVAGTVASPRNGIGISGVAPGVEVVNLRAGQDSGYFFLQATLDALTYAGDHGVDVVNMSYYVDPWLYNCRANPADSPEEQAEQATTIDAVQRALDYAHRKGVTLISSAGNGATNIDNPVFDGSSPNFPPGEEHDRTIDNSCLTMPTEGDNVIGVTALGPSVRKAYYSNWGLEQADVSAPGGDAYDFPTDPPASPPVPTPANMILAPYPEALAIEAGEIDPETGQPTTPFVVADCTSGDCSYFQYLQGTSMASPHATGVAALIVSEHGKAKGKKGFGMSPTQVERRLLRSATDYPCPPGGTQVYPGLPARYTATCEGRMARNSFYGEGIVDAARAVTQH